MYISDYVIFGSGTFQIYNFDVKKGYKRVNVLGKYINDLNKEKRISQNGN